MSRSTLDHAWHTLTSHMCDCPVCAGVVREQKPPEYLCPEGAGLYSEWLMARHLAGREH